MTVGPWFDFLSAITSVRLQLNQIRCFNKKAHPLIHFECNGKKTPALRWQVENPIPNCANHITMRPNRLVNSIAVQVVRPQCFSEQISTCCEKQDVQIEYCISVLSCNFSSSLQNPAGGKAFRVFAVIWKTKGQSSIKHGRCTSSQPAHHHLTTWNYIHSYSKQLSLAANETDSWPNMT